MRINCPYCGDRDSREFIFRGDAAPARPKADADQSDFADYVYLRANPCGPIEELWYHRSGCRNWLRVSRDTRTHAVEGARLAAGAAR